MKISQREMVLGVSTLAAVLIGVTWYLVDSRAEEWKAMAGTIEKTEQQIRHYQTAIKMQEEWLGELDELQDELREFEDNKRSVSPELMKTIKTISGKHALDITRSQPYAEKPTGSLFELGINCTWQGSLEAMVAFLTELQQQGVSYDVRQLNVTPVGKNTGMLKGNMVIHCAYTRKSAEELKRAEAKQAEELRQAEEPEPAEIDPQAAIPAEAVPEAVLPKNAELEEAIPAEAVPVAAMPKNAELEEAIPADADPVDAGPEEE